MAEGTVSFIHSGGEWGKIQPDSGGEQVYFRLNWVKNLPLGGRGIQKGTRLTYEVEMGERGPRTKWVRLAESQGNAAPIDASLKDEKRQGGKKPYRFLNPYNFVRSPREPQVLPDEPGTALLGRCQPPPHDRWVGLNGTIICEVEAVTPLFISDSEHWEDASSEHATYQFYQYDFGTGLEPALPASSLRGMLRGEFEAVTNSCYAHFDYGRRLSYHLPANDALKLIPARVEQDDNGRWWLRLLPGTAQLVVGERPRDKLYAGRVERYKAMSYAGRRRQAPELREVDLHNLKHGDHCFAQVQELQFPPVWNVLNLAKTRSELPKSGGQIVEGYVCINNQNIETKRFERFFFRNPQNRFGPEKILLSEDARQKYRDLIQDYQTRHADEVARWRKQGRRPDQPWFQKKAAAFSRFILDDYREIRDGDLVYVMLSGSLQAPNIEFIAPVAVPRVSYKRKMDDLLPAHLWKCRDYDHLCPACRMFGWVYSSARVGEKTPSISATTAYAGRLRFSHGRMVGEAMKMGEVELAVLGSPKPTTTRFYLKPASGKPQKGQNDSEAGYDNRQNVLRGRKLYRHHGHTGNLEYWLNQQREYRSRMKKSNQNRTVKGALAPGARFRFSIQFENLAPVELGALLWTLRLEGKGYHRLGYAKPLGFGSLRLADLQLEIVNMEKHLSANWLGDELDQEPQQQPDWVELFKTSMALAYEQSFAQLPHLQEMLALLGEPPEDIPIHYPRTDPEPNSEGKNFEWFMGNNRNRDARFTLELPGGEQGLPLIDRTGQVKS